MIDLSAGALVIVDKPAGMTSHDVVQRLRRVTGIRRIGHAGTLDPLATGVLPILFGPATRLLRFLPSDPKVYRTTARFGQETTTGDIDGEPTGPALPATFSAHELAAATRSMLGQISQLPPMYSAKKVGGRRLHEAARAGIEVDRQPITVRVDRLEIRGREGDDLELEIECSPGTYVRSLVLDLGRALGTAATVAQLRRLRSGRCRVEEAVPLDQLDSRHAVAGVAQSIDQMPLDLPEVCVDSAAARAFQAGQPSPCAGPPVTAIVAVRDAHGLLLGIGEALAASDGAQTVVHPRVVLARGVPEPTV